MKYPGDLHIRGDFFSNDFPAILILVGTSIPICCCVRIAARWIAQTSILLSVRGDEIMDKQYLRFWLIQSRSASVAQQNITSSQRAAARRQSPLASSFSAIVSFTISSPQIQLITRNQSFKIKGVGMIIQTAC